ncbi:RDD family protein [Candidatus Endoriftia persephone]|jgi:uncharacterized RDD family membrane protein YckC|uniref:RDD domain protein n=3 Tax=Gammaproteobacteria TaxID=1236 RepID=G2FBI0_9GAMM|nr:RDD family protein [Candidatus Endoriftia persephone]EGW55661.1 RDD domain protein [endosymbiont of Tevnia jerichonana (vent Tica)]USF86347.1 RDD family protein [Candidatus Endoriftia persephone]
MTDPAPIDIENAILPGFLRRLGAMFYDSLLLLALIMLSITLITLPLGMPEGNALLFFQLFLWEIIPLLFFTGFWVHGGQTLGMRAWRLRLVRSDGLPPTWRDALRRHLAALFSLVTFGLGFLWILVDPNKLAWHDHLSATRLVLSQR